MEVMAAATASSERTRPSSDPLRKRKGSDNHKSVSNEDEAGGGAVDGRSCRTAVNCMANVAADEVAKTTKEAAGMASDTAQMATEKAKKAMHDAWGKATETTQKVKESVANKAENGVDYVKDTAEAAKRN